jgi:RNA polymerase sigma-70 factor (sigma-E family)
VADEAGFTAFVDDASRGLLRTAWLLTGDWSSAEDLVQATLVKVWARWDSIDRAAAHGYVRRVMLTTFLGWRARRWSGETPTESLPERATDHDALRQVELRALLLPALLALPRQQRAVVVLRYFDDLTEASTAEVLGCSIGTVKSHAARALNTLRQVPGLNPIVDKRTAT